MAKSLKEFLEQPPSEPEKCIACGDPLCPIPDVDPHPPRRTPAGPICGDCSIEGMSTAIDEHPIGRPMSRT